MSTDSQGNAKEDIATVTTTGELYRMVWEKLGERTFEAAVVPHHAHHNPCSVARAFFAAAECFALLL